MAEDLTGKTLGPFQIERRIGQGAMGAVYLARRRDNGKKAAIKVMTPPNAEAVAKLAARFEREIKLLAKIRHPNIVRFYRSGEDGGVRYYAMEFVDGASLEALLAGGRILSLNKTIAYAVQICDALQEMHAIGVVHRDLKPANVLVTGDGKVKLTDFGVAKDTSAFSEAKLTAADHTVGTVAYMSPEQLAGKELTRKSDLYALGILIYRMLTGRLPFTAETMFDYVQQRQAGVYPPATTINPSLPLEVDALLAELMAQKPDDRPRDAYVVMQRLLDLGKALKEGTLSRSRSKLASETVAETVEMKRGSRSTLLGTVFGAKESRKSKKKTLEKSDAEAGSFLESPIVLVSALALVVAFSVYMFWPLSDAQRFARGKAAMAKENLSSSDMQRIDEEYFQPILAKNPASPHADEIAKFRDQAALKRARERVNRARLRDFAPADDAGEPERQFLEAMRLKEKRGDPANAEERFRALQTLFRADPAAKPWIALAEEELAGAAAYASDQERIEAKRRAVRAALERARAMRAEGELEAALAEYGAMEKLYGADPDVADLVWKAGVEFLTPQDLFARGRRRMESDDPADWSKAFELYFNPLEEIYPNHNERDAVAAYRLKLAKHDAGVRAAEHLKVGLPPDASEAERLYTVALFVRSVLEDPYTAHDALARVVGRFADDQDARAWVALAEETLEQKPESADREHWTLAKQDAARAALKRLEERIASDPDQEIWRAPVHQMYLSDADTSRYVEDRRGE
jgi:serine/threonine-protein kinase